MRHEFGLPEKFKVVGLEETRGGFQAYVRERNKLGPLGYGFERTVDEAFTAACVNLEKRLRDMPAASEPSAPAALSGLKLNLSRLTRRE